VVAGNSALLRPSPAPLVRAALLGFLALAAIPSLASAASHAPDPSPAGGLVAPDPYPASLAPAPQTAPARITTLPISVQRLPVTVQTPPAAAKHSRKGPVVRRKPHKAVLHRTKPAQPVRIPDHAAPRLVALARTAVEQPQDVSRKLVLALGALVLLSGSLVAGAARELAR
jgi:hypothetical protein